MKIVAPSIVTTRDPQGLKFISIAEAAYNKARLSEGEEAQRVNDASGLSVLIDNFIAENRLADESATAMPVPATLAELRNGSQWRPILRLLKKTGRAIRVAESGVFMGQYSAVLLTSDGFQLESGNAGMTAAIVGSNPKRTPIRRIKEVLEKAIAFSEPLEDDPPGTLTPSESEIIARFFEEIEELRNCK